MLLFIYCRTRTIGSGKDFDSSCYIEGGQTIINLSAIEGKIQILLIQIKTIFLQFFFSIFASMFFFSFFPLLLLVIISYITRWFIYSPRDTGLNKERVAHILLRVCSNVSG